MMKKYLLLLVGVLGVNTYAQRSCSTDQKMKAFFEKNPQALARKADLRNFLTSKNNVKKSTQTVVTVPVVVHVIYKNPNQNVSDAQIASQIAVLNQDFRKQNSDFSSVVPPVFQPMGADLELAFCMATKKPDGSPTNGIERKSVASSFDFENDYYESNGMSAWDPTKYLNIWVGELPDGLLGWAYLPDAAGENYDGLAIGYQYFGTTGSAVAPFNKGRTATHEIGHYFGLDHPWGDGNCTTDDGCADTPATNDAYYNSPVFPDNAHTCVTVPTGAMFMNYMDYVNDANMALFTNDQKTITQNTMIEPRASLLNSNACAVLAVGEVEKANSINIFPNPTSHYISIASPLAAVDEVEIFNSEGRLVRKAFIKNETDKIDIKDLANGVYYVRTYNDRNFVKSMKFIKK